ncbi:MAG: leucyl/phenylalanyl-tRNA--protein transferase [Planctomycetota bacterium]|nr:leucyl/phenylalanyl-tRNA--protein transferase [Planctomycetota bacterium]
MADPTEHPDPISPELVLEGYARGIFPMADPADGSIGWYCPDPRAVLPLDAVHVPRSLARTVRSGRFRITVDLAFEEVIRACAAPRIDEPESWIDERIIEVFTRLHRLGWGHSFEAWSGDELVAGLYGVAVGGAFFGESMFSDPVRGRDGSKVCLVHLVDHLRRCDFRLLDVQFTTGHLERFGCIELDRAEFLARLHRAVSEGPRWRPFADDSCDSST